MDMKTNHGHKTNNSLDRNSVELETLLEQKDNIIKSYEVIFQNRFNEKK